MTTRPAGIWPPLLKGPPQLGRPSGRHHSIVSWVGRGSTSAAPCLRAVAVVAGGAAIANRSAGPAVGRVVLDVHALRSAAGAAAARAVAARLAAAARHRAAAGLHAHAALADLAAGARGPAGAAIGAVGGGIETVVAGPARAADRVVRAGIAAGAAIDNGGEAGAEAAAAALSVRA